MTQIGNRNAVTVLSPEGSTMTPTPRTRLRLTSVNECRRELAKVYIAARKGKIPTGEATRLAYLLVSLSNMIRDNELEDRIAALESKG
jgi:hypothetical protein